MKTSLTQLISSTEHSLQRIEKSLSYLTGLLVRDTLRDSRQLSNFSSVMPERSSWTYSWDESVHSCLLFLSPPWKQNSTNTVMRVPHSHFNIMCINAMKKWKKKLYKKVNITKIHPRRMHINIWFHITIQHIHSDKWEQTGLYHGEDSVLFFVCLYFVFSVGTVSGWWITSNLDSYKTAGHKTWPK